MLPEVSGGAGAGTVPVWPAGDVPECGLRSRARKVTVMSDRPCLSNDELWERVHYPLDRPFPCRRRGMSSEGVRIPQGHYASCSDDECRGCVPRSASHGYLCHVCYGSLVNALDRAPNLITHLRSVNRSGQALGERVATSMERSILIPNSWAAADAIMDALNAPTIPSTSTIDDTADRAGAAIDEWVTHLDQWVNMREGAKRALVLMRRMRVALRQFPDSEAEYRHVPKLRCQDCAKESLFRKGPEFFGDDCMVVCGTPGCGFTRDWWSWFEFVAPIFEHIMAAEQGRKPKTVTPPKPRMSRECETGEHHACRLLECRCDHHYERTWSLWSPPARKKKLDERSAA